MKNCKLTFVVWFQDATGDWDFASHSELFETEEQINRFMEINKNNKLISFHNHKITKLALPEYKSANSIPSYHLYGRNMKYEYKVTFIRWFRDRNGDWDFDDDQEYFLTEKLAERFIEVNSNKKSYIFNDFKIIKLKCDFSFHNYQ